MRKLNGFSIGATSGVPARLQRPVDVKQHERALALIVDVVITLANSTAAAITLTNAQALDLMQKIFSSWTLAFGVKAVETVDDAKSFDDMRKLCIALTGRDMRFNGKQLRDYANTDADAIVVPAGGTAAVRVGFIRPFFFERAGARLDDWCPYASQLRHMQLVITRGGALSTAGLSQSGNADAVVFVDTVDSETADGWAPVPRMFASNDGGLIHEGPAGGGALLCLYEDTAIGSAVNAALIVSVERKGDNKLQDQMEAASLVRDSNLRRDQDSVNLNTLATVLFELPEQVTPEKIPTASEFKLRQQAQTLSPMQSRWIYVPAISEAIADGVIGPNLAEQNGPTKMVTAQVLNGKDIPGHVAAVSSVAAVPLDSPKADLFDGRIATKNGTAVHYSPIANGALSGASGDHGAKLVAQAIKSRAKAIPGGRSPQRGAATAAMSRLVDAGAPGGLVDRVKGFFR